MAGVDRIPLEVGSTDLSIGQYSVGFPPTRTGEQIVEAYLELVTLIRAIGPDDVRVDDFDMLAATTGLDRSFIENRVYAHLATARTAS